MNLLKKVSEVREQFERKELDKILLKKLYSRYTFVDDLDFFIMTALNQFPKLNCGLATVYLQYLLGGNIIKGKYKDNSHTFLVLNNLVIDITSDQYRGPKVYVGELNLPWSVK
ncbi:hypothetical protein HY837_00900 [archaeon]|nr:hypothetical protein [archaeon]